MKRMLINATQPEELRVAIVDGQKLINLDIESTGKEQKKSNIYLGVVTRIEPSLEAAFVDYGAKRHGFLSVKDVAPDIYAHPSGDHHARLHIRDALVEGQQILVQVEKEERGSKGAALTTFISLAGCYLVLVPNNPRAAGISKRVEGDERSGLKEILESLPLPEGMGLIARTASAGRSHAELEWDLQALVERWQTIQQVAKEQRGPILIHQESGVLIRSIRDHLREDISEILLDEPEVFNKTREYVRSLRPDYINRVKLYRDTVPLFNRYQVESTIESAFQREVKLPSGGSIVIDRTEALVSIDINSSKATKGTDIEETAFNTNLEAAEEIARQLRLRDLAGLIVIDFIDMAQTNHQRDVENRLREALHDDRARVQTGRISRFGLLEMSRQRLGPTLAEAIEDICPTCSGHGTIRGVASLSLMILRGIEEEAIKDNTAQVHAQLPVEVATYLLNEKRKQLAQIEQKHKVEIIIIPNQYIHRPHYDLSRVRTEEALNQTAASFKLVRLPGANAVEEAPTERRAEPVLKALRDSGSQRQPGIIQRIISNLFGDSKEATASPSETPAAEATTRTAPVDRRSSRGNPDRNRSNRQQQRRPAGRQRRDSTTDAAPVEAENMLSEDALLQQRYEENKQSTEIPSRHADKERRQERSSRHKPAEEKTEAPKEEEITTYTFSNNPDNIDKMREAISAIEVAQATQRAAAAANPESEMVVEVSVEQPASLEEEPKSPVASASEEPKSPVTSASTEVFEESHSEAVSEPFEDESESIGNRLEEPVDQDKLESQEQRQAPKKRRQQRPYRGPGRRRPRDQQARKPQAQEGESHSPKGEGQE